MKRMFDTAECEAVRNSIFWELRYEKHENQMKGCGVEQKVSDWQMNVWISCVIPCLYDKTILIWKSTWTASKLIMFS